MTYDEATNSLPSDAYCTSTFGRPGAGGYVENWRTPDGRRFYISNGPWDAARPFKWVVTDHDAALAALGGDK